MATSVSVLCGVCATRSLWQPVAQSFVVYVRPGSIWLHRNNKASQMSRRERDEQPVMTYQVEV